MSDTSIFDKVPRTFTWLVYWRYGVTRDCKWSTMTLQVASLIRRSRRKRHRTENNRSWLSTCSQVIRPWHLKVQHAKPCHTFKKLDVFAKSSERFVNCLLMGGGGGGGGQLRNLQKPDHFKLWRVMNIFLGLFQWWKSFLERMKFEFTGVSCFTNIVKFSWLFIQKLKIGQSCILTRYILWKTLVVFLTGSLLLDL